MQDTSDLYKTILSGDYSTEVKLCIAGIDYDETVIASMETVSGIFSSSTPEPGGCVSAEIDIKMLLPNETIPRQAEMIPYVRITDGEQYSEWLQKGVFYIDTRSVTMTSDKLHWLTIHGYDAMLKTEVNYPSSTIDWPGVDIDVVNEIAAYIGVTVDARTTAIMTNGYTVQYPSTDYSCREVLGYIAANYGGCFVMSDHGELLLVRPHAVSLADSTDIGMSVKELDIASPFDEITRVEVILSDETAYTSGDDTGRTLSFENPWGTQEIADTLLTEVQGYSYQPYNATGARLNPAMELGDGVTVKSTYSGMFTMTARFASAFIVDISAPSDEEIDSEYPYVSPTERKITRQVAQSTSEFKVTAEEIKATVRALETSVSNSLSSVEILYALGDSSTVAPTSGWSSTAPEWVDGMYMWQKTITTKSSGGTEETVTCISGATGSTGEAGADGADAITLIIDSSNGDSFKNSKISTTLTVNIIVAGNYIDCSRKMYEYFGDTATLSWETRGYGEDDYTAVASDDPRLSDNGFIFTLSTADVDTKIVCRCYLDY